MILAEVTVALAASGKNPPVAQLVWLLVLAALTSAVARWIKVPYTVALVVVGVLTGALGLLTDVRPTSDVILLVFLPPLLFQSALDIDLRLLGQTLPAIVALAVPGVVVSAIVVGLIVARGTALELWPALLFGALISATDPVAVVATFRQMGAPDDLTLIVEGESLFNDGTALVLSVLLVTAAQTGTFQVGSTLLLFLWSVLGGISIGIFSGFAVSQMTRLVDDRSLELTMSTVLAFGSYLLSDRIGASGVLAVVAAGIVYGSHGRDVALSTESRRALDAFWSYVGFLANALLFILIGLEIRLGALWDNRGAVAVSLLAVLLARAIIVYPLTLWMRRIEIAYAHVLFWGGLRGGVALAVALSLTDSVPGRRLLLTLTFGVVLFTILIQGLTIDPLVLRLGLIDRAADKAPDADRSENHQEQQ